MSRKHALFLIVSCFLFLPVSAHAVTHNVNIGDNFFSPNNLPITVGDTVHWSYNGGRSHDATADDGTWGLVRASSNKPELVVVVESPVSEARMRDMFAAIDGILRENPEVGDYNQTI